MKRELITNIMRSNENAYFMFRTDLAAGRGINGIEFRHFNTKDYFATLSEEYICFSKKDQQFFVEYEHINSVEAFYGNRYNYTCGGIDPL